MIEIKAVPDKPIMLGKQGENLAREVIFDVSGVRAEFGDGTFQLSAKRPGEASVYPATITEIGDTVVWALTGADMQNAGNGQCELAFLAGETRYKTWTYNTAIARSLTGSLKTDPFEGFLDEINRLAAEAAISQMEAKNSEKNAKASEDAAKISETSAASSAAAAAESAVGLADAVKGAKDAATAAAKSAEGLADAVKCAKDAAANAQDNAGKTAADREAVAEMKTAAQTAQGNAEKAAAAAAGSATSAGESAIAAETSRAGAAEIKAQIDEIKAGIDTTKSEIDQAKGDIDQTKTDILAAATIKKYSVRFSGSAAAGVREDNAVGMVANVAVGDETVVNDFDDVSFFDRPICCCTFDADNLVWRVNAYKGEPGFAWDGSNGEVMYECKPCAHSDNTDLNTYVSVTGTPCEGYTLFECFKDWNTKLYLPVFNLAMVDGKAASRAGYFPEQESNNSAMTHARTFHAKASSETIEAYFYETCLQLVEFATKDLQTKMMGASTLSYNGTDPIITSVVSSTVFKMAAKPAAAFVAGQSVSIGTERNGMQRTPNVVISSLEADPDDSASSIVTLATAVENLAAGDYLSSRMYITGVAAKAVTNASSGSPVSNSSGKYPCIWRGKENPWGNGFSCISNLLIKRNGEGTNESPYTYKPFYLPYPEKYSNGVITDDYIEADFNVPTSDGYAKSFGRDRRYPFLFVTKEIGGTSTTYGCAYYYASPNVVSGVRVGGNFFYGRSCGLYFNCFIAPSGPWVNYCSRLFCNP